MGRVSLCYSIESIKSPYPERSNRSGDLRAFTRFRSSAEDTPAARSPAPAPRRWRPPRYPALPLPFPGPFLLLSLLRLFPTTRCLRSFFKGDDTNILGTPLVTPSRGEYWRVYSDCHSVISSAPAGNTRSDVVLLPAPVVSLACRLVLMRPKRSIVHLSSSRTEVRLASEDIDRACSNSGKLGGCSWAWRRDTCKSSSGACWNLGRDRDVWKIEDRRKKLRLRSFHPDCSRSRLCSTKNETCSQQNSKVIRF